MKAKLILVSKEKTEYPKFENIRPISVLPTITKVFELSILHHLENATQSIKFCKTQRGFLKGRSTLDNIHDLLNLSKNLQDKWRQNKQIKPAIVFFDFRKANDSVPRDRLLMKLSQLDVPDNITLLIGNMLKKFWLIYEKEKIKTSGGLVQGSVLSPLLFNIFINDLMLLYQVSGIKSRAYADDIVCIWKSIDESKKGNINNEGVVSQKQNGNKPCQIRNPHNIDQEEQMNWKSNELMIPEIENYRCLGVTINQWLKLRDHEWILKNSEAELRKKGILKSALLNTKSRLILYRTILKSKYWYAEAVLWIHSPYYATKLDSILYRLLKQLFHIKSNVKKPFYSKY